MKTPARSPGKLYTQRRCYATLRGRGRRQKNENSGIQDGGAAIMKFIKKNRL